MSATLVAAGLTAAYGDKVLFDELSFVLAPGDVIGLVGANGAGKSTLLQILAGIRPADGGSVTRSPSTANIGYLPQERAGMVGETLTEYLARRTGVAPAERAMNEAAEALAAGVLGADDVYASALDTWLGLGGADLPDRMAAACADVGLDVSPTAELSSLSGGQSARAGLAVLLLSRFDLFLLDEPTNDLDLDGLTLLETFVTGLRAGAVIVSHDREFLNRTVSSVLELDLAQHQTRMINGGYQVYLAEREIARRHARAEFEEYDDKRQQLLERARTQRAWMSKGVANARRKATDNDKIGRNLRSETSEKQAAKARQTERLIERIPEVAEPRKEWQLRMQIAPAARSGSIAASANGAVVRRGDFTLGPVSLQVNWADRVVITGANGAGKSTLLELLLGRTEPEAGTASLGPGVIVGEVDQARALLDDDVSLIRAMSAALPDLPDAELRTLLAKFGLRAEHVHRPTEQLSPGERTRAALAILQERQVNLLVLDEPTNHLDLPAIEQLESALDSFPGTVLLVSHDRALLAQMRSTRRIAVDNGIVTEL